MKHIQLALAGLVAGSLAVSAKAGELTWWDENFSSYNGSIDALTNQVENVGGNTHRLWTRNGEDESTIQTSWSNKTDVLVLNTQGEDLTFAPTNRSDSTDKVLVSADVFFVGSETEPTLTDSDIQFALFLKTPENEGEGNNVLMVYVYDQNATGTAQGHWVELQTASPIKDKEWHHIEVSLNYTSESQAISVSVDGTEVGTGFSPVNTSAATQLNSVSFRGTGGVDNFTGKFVTEDVYTTHTFTSSVFVNGVKDTSLDKTKEGSANGTVTFEQPAFINANLLTKIVKLGLNGASDVVYTITDNDGSLVCSPNDGSFVDNFETVSFTAPCAGAAQEGQSQTYPLVEFYYGTTPSSNAAAVNGTEYETFAEAVAAAAGTANAVTLLNNIALSSTVEITNNVVIDLNGKNITATGSRAIWVKSGNVKITGEGTVSAEVPSNGASSVIRVGDAVANPSVASLMIDTNVVVSSATCYGVTVFGKNDDGNAGTTDMTFDLYGTVSVTSSGDADAAISGNGRSDYKPVAITVHDGATVSSTASAAIYFPGKVTLVIDGGTITGKHGIVARAGEIVVNGGSISATGGANDGEVVGDGSSIVPCAAIVYDTKAGYPFFDAGNAVTINGGSISAAISPCVQQLANENDASAVVIPGTSHAVFSDAAADGVAEGYTLVETAAGSGLYTIAKTWTVVYENWDGTQLQSSTVVEGETTPAYVGEAPARAADAQYTYTFSGWGDVAATVQADTNYVAQFTTVVNEYTISWDTDGDGTVDDTTTVAYGTVPTHADGAKAADSEYTYTFAAWDPAVVAVSGVATYTATFTQVPVEAETPSVNPGDNLPAGTDPISFNSATGLVTIRFVAPAAGTYKLLSSTDLTAAKEAWTADGTPQTVEAGATVELTEGTTGTVKFFKIGYDK